MATLKVVERRLGRFLRDPGSIRGAMSMIVTATALVVVGGGVLMRVVDRKEYGSIWIGMWWAVQTVTTVGYGDVTPRAPGGRAVATLTMCYGIAFLAIVTAAITSTFVERASQRRQRERQAEEERVDARFDELERRLERIEESLSRAFPK